MSVAEPFDRRAARTRRAIVGAFVALVLERRYDGISVSDIAARADVGRSTFYEHFRGKDELLHQSMEPLLALLADAALPDADEGPVRFVVSHFWDNRRLARAVMAHPLGAAVRRVLVSLIEARLVAAHACAPELVALRAVQVAAAQLALLDGWTRGEITAGQDRIVGQLLAAGRV
jgi:AcrR family transcriptional regulator